MDADGGWGNTLSAGAQGIVGSITRIRLDNRPGLRDDRRLSIQSVRRYTDDSLYFTDKPANQKNYGWFVHGVFCRAAIFIAVVCPYLLDLYFLMKKKTPSIDGAKQD